MFDPSKKSFPFYVVVIFITIVATRTITRTTGFPTSTFDHSFVIFALDLSLFVFIFFAIGILLEKSGLFKDKFNITE